MAIIVLDDFMITPYETVASPRELQSTCQRHSLPARAWMGKLRSLGRRTATIVEAGDANRRREIAT
jgi:hypothetical protein